MTNRTATALAFLQRPDLVRWACNPRNPAFHRADALTRDAHGHRIHEYLTADRDWAGTVQRLIRGPLTAFQETMTGEPVRLAQIRREGRKPRLVAIPTFLRRCISNLVNDVLTMTCSRLLPPSVRAYRKGYAGAVREALLDVAQSVVDGSVVYFAKLDFSNFFPSMPWALIEESLFHYGFETEFVAFVMAVVRCPLVAGQRGGPLRPVHNARGAQMGLAESSFLANLVPFAIDEYMRVKASKLFYSRYSDDLIIGSRFAHEVVGAVRFVQNWCRRYELSLKGVSPDMHPRRLVRDVRRSRIEFLGAEIDQNGVIHLPQEKLDDKLGRLSRMSERFPGADLPPGDVHVTGISRYGDGEGVDLFDADDLRRTADGFIEYWMNLDEREARRAEGILRRRFPMLPAPSGTGCGTVWSAQLWSDQAVNGAETLNPVHLTRSIDPGPSRSSAPCPPPKGVGGKAEGCRNRCSLSTHRGGPLGGEAEGHRDRGSCNGLGPHLSLQSDGVALGREEEGWADQALATADVLEESVLYTGCEEGEGSCSWDAGPTDSMITRDHRFHSPSEGDPTETEEVDLLDHQDLKLLGAVGDTAVEGDLFGFGDESPVPPWIENDHLVHLACARLPDPVGTGCIVATVTSIAGVVGRPALRTIRGCNPETAAVVAITSLLRAAHSQGWCLLHAVLADVWLPKMLVQRQRRFRSPLLLKRVLVLHELARQTGVRVTISGPIPTPMVLRRALAQALDEHLRGHVREREAREDATRCSSV